MKTGRSVKQSVIGAAYAMVVLTIVACGGGGTDSLSFLKPTVPVVVSYRESFWGQGKVAIFTNQSANRLTISVTFENKRLKQQKLGNIDLEPNGKAEIGWLEGWQFESGETIAIGHPNYSSRTLTIP